MTPPRRPLGRSPRLADTRYEVRAAVEAVCSHWPLPATRKPVSSRWRTAAWATNAAIRAATASNCSAFLSPQATTLSGTKPRCADEVGHRLRHPVLGNELL